MLLGLTLIDSAVLAAYLAVMLGIGAYFSGQQRSSDDFFLAGRSMSWFPIGLSVMATLLSALSYTGIPGEAYFAGFRFLLLPIAVWAALPVLHWIVLPLYHGLRLCSVYEYLEMRFDWTTRLVSSLVFVVWRLLWLGGVLYAPCKVLVVAADLQLPIWLLLMILGAVSTAYTYLGGMKAVIWTDVVQTMVMVAGLLLILGGVWTRLDGGAGRVWEVAESFGRTQVVESQFSWDSKWTIWGILPHFWLSMLSFYIADQITAQRFLTAKNLLAARRSFALNCLSVSIMIPALAYVGVSLLAFYYDHPQAMPAKWVVNVDHTTGRSLTFADRNRIAGADLPIPAGRQPGDDLIDWSTDALDAAAVATLVRQQRLLRPNVKEPFDRADELILRGSGGDQLDIDKLAMRKPPPLDRGLRRGEVVLNVRARDELMPRFIRDQLPAGIAGLILAALFAASMSSMDSGLNSICTLLITDFYRRFGWGRGRLAARLGKSPEHLTDEDELKLSRFLVLCIGILATLFSLIVAGIGNIFEIMIGVVNTFGGPLMAVFLLGIFTRRCTPRAALMALVAGTLFTIWLMGANTYRLLAWSWPFEQSLNSIWPLIFGVGFTLLVGYLAGFVTGPTKTKQQLRGLVYGLGRLGTREPEEASIAIIDPDEAAGEDQRWR